VLAHDAANRSPAPVRNDQGADAPAALDHRQDRRPVAFLLQSLRVSFGGAKVAAIGRLVDLNVAIELAIVVVGQERADLLEHPVRRLVGDADLALQLLGAYPTAGAAH